MPYFTVVIPTYNRADLLPRCIDSVLNQVFNDFEIIVVDNYSKDETKQMMEEYMANDSRISFIQEHNNGVIAHSRNIGIKAAKGKYIALLDSDDWFAKEKLQVIYNVCESSKPDVLYSRYRMMTSNGKGKVCGKELICEDKFHELLMGGDIICNATVVVKKEAIENVGYLSEDMSLCAVEDMDLWLRLAKNGASFYFVKDCLSFYWVGDNLSYSSKHVEKIKNLYEKFIPYIISENMNKCLMCRDYTIARTYHKIGYFSEALIHYKKVMLLQKYPQKIKTLFLMFFALFKKSM